jgi:membrane protein implicated in regulation of membrane protease activity
MNFFRVVGAAAAWIFAVWECAKGDYVAAYTVVVIVLAMLFIDVKRAVKRRRER